MKRFKVKERDALSSPVDGDQGGLWGSARGFGQTQYCFFIGYVFAEEAHSVFVGDDMWHGLYEQLRRFATFVEIGYERRHFDVLEQPVALRGVRSAAVSSVQKH